jgi:hypothetical protein
VQPAFPINGSTVDHPHGFGARPDAAARAAHSSLPSPRNEEHTMMQHHVDAARMAAPITPWCPDEDTRDNVVARRNVLAALWAGQLRGLTGPALTAYAVEVHLADFTMPGDADVVEKIASDLQRAGLVADPADIRARLAAFHRQALLQTNVTD